MPWDPHRYLQFGDHRTRPAVDLLARVPVEQPALVYDLGCGPGNSTRLLVERWPSSEVVGVDSSEPMLAAAREQVPQAGYLLADLTTWQPDRTASVVFSNATLHWLDDHPRLLPRVVSWVAPGGFLAVQMPRNFGSPSHRIAAELAADPRWRDRLSSRVRVDPVASAESYYELLSPICQWVEVWETEYLHVLGGEDPVVDWLRGTLLVPLLDPLDGAERTVFITEFSARVSSVHPRRSDGTTLYPFRRLFLVAVKPPVSTPASG